MLKGLGVPGETPKPWFLPQVPKNVPRSATKIAIGTPGSRPVAGGQETPSEGQRGESF